MPCLPDERKISSLTMHTQPAAHELAASQEQAAAAPGAPPAAFSICFKWYSSCSGDRSVWPSTAALRKGGCSLRYMGAVSYSSDTRSTCSATATAELKGSAEASELVRQGGRKGDLCV
jgi:hypothetical protein